MAENSLKETKLYPCDIDYIVKEKGRFYIVYGWKQTMFPLDKLPKKEQAEIMKDFNSGQYGERLNRVPLSDF